MKSRNKKPKERPKYNMWQNSAFMIREAWHTRKSVLFICIALIVISVFQSLTELFITPVILSKIEAQSPLSSLLGTILFFTLLLTALSCTLTYFNENAMFGKIEIRSGIVNKINAKASLTSLPNSENAEVLKMQEKAAIACCGNDQATEAIWHTFTELLKSVIGFAIYLALLSSLTPLLVAVVLVTAVIGYFVTNRINEWGYNHREKTAEYDKKLGYLSEISTNSAIAKDIRIFGMKPWLDEVHTKALRAYKAFVEKREGVYVWGNVTDVLLSVLRNGIAYFYLINLALKSDLSAPQFLLYFTAIGGFTTWITTILTNLSTLRKQSLDICVVREYLEYPEPFKFEDGKPLAADVTKPYEITLKNVSFRYPKAEKDIIHNLNLTVRAGEKLAIVGLNGAGKTTLVKLICGFYDPTEGEVLLNGENIKNYNRRDYYKHFSAVFQQFSVLDVTLKENVAQTYKNIDMARLADCIEKAGLTKKVESLPQGYETHIGREVYEDGAELSGGETQRLMLARALYKNAPIIVLDEPTAALDPIAENDIYMKYSEMTDGRTSVFISHRLASTRFCDRIIFLADGGIAEEGSHEVLMQKGGEYSKLFEVQSKYYQKGSVVNE